MSLSAKHPFLAPILLSVALATMLSACGSSEPEKPVAVQRPTQGVEPATIWAELRQMPDFAIFAKLVERANMHTALAQPTGSQTMLVGRQSTFAPVPPEQRAAMVQADPQQLANILNGLMIARTYSADELRTLIDQGQGSFVADAVNGQKLTFTRDGDMLIVTTPTGTASIGTQAIATGNGAIYVLDKWVAPVPAPGVGASAPAAGPGAPATPAATPTPAPTTAR